MRMKHFGDITKIHGWEVPIVDVVTGGSPCQDLSVAGKREGLAGERSGLFMEQIRIVKEMREYDTKTNGHLGIYVRPRYLVWENVTGAFSSNGGEDFRVALEEICKVADSNTTIPRPTKWSNSGCIMGNGWSVAWRVHDAQFWGTPQRRRRMCVIADFGGGSAPEILFERKGLSWYSESCEATEKGFAGNIRESIEKSDRNDLLVAYRKRGHPQTSEGGQGYMETDRIDTLNTFDNGEMRTPTLILENHPMDSRVKIKQDGIFQTLNARMGTGGNNVPMLLELENHHIIRRLTPLECERLQMFPDGWTDIGDWVDSKGKKHKGESDSPRYKALGNSIALPFWGWMAERMVAQLRKDGSENPTMASLFDGIGGFPLVYQRNGCKPVWASEIEEFPMAVTKIRFPEGE